MHHSRLGVVVPYSVADRTAQRCVVGGFCSVLLAALCEMVRVTYWLHCASDADPYALHALMHVAPVRQHPIQKLLPPQACTHACSHALWHARVLVYTHTRIHPGTSGPHSAVCMWCAVRISTHSVRRLTGGAKPISSASLSSAVACVPSASRSITCATVRCNACSCAASRTEGCTEGLLHRVVCCTLHRGSVAFRVQPCLDCAQPQLFVPLGLLGRMPSQHCRIADTHGTSEYCRALPPADYSRTSMQRNLSEETIRPRSALSSTAFLRLTRLITIRKRHMSLHDSLGHTGSRRIAASTALPQQNAAATRRSAACVRQL